jgi:hypothetical protein
LLALVTGDPLSISADTDLRSQTLVSFEHRLAAEVGSELQGTPGVQVLGHYTLVPHFWFAEDIRSPTAFTVHAGGVIRPSGEPSYATVELCITYGDVRPRFWGQFEGGMAVLVNGFASSRDWTISPIAALIGGYNHFFLRLRGMISSNSTVVADHYFTLGAGWTWSL